MSDVNQKSSNEQVAESLLEIIKRSAREAVSLYFQPILHPRETLDDLLGRTREEPEQGSSKGTERR